LFGIIKSSKVNISFVLNSFFQELNPFLSVFLRPVFEPSSASSSRFSSKAAIASRVSAFGFIPSGASSSSSKVQVSSLWFRENSWFCSFFLIRSYDTICSAWKEIVNAPQVTLRFTFVCPVIKSGSMLYCFLS
jgi:hypothetical protein